MTHPIAYIGFYVIFGVVLLPVYAMIAGWLIGKPRDFKTVGVGLASVFGLIAAMIVGVWVGGTLVGLLMGV